MSPDKPFADHFSERASGYARYRPTYPASLAAWLASLAPARETAWDCGTGSGQAAQLLAAEFERVVATDPSESQLGNARPHPRITYRVGRESQSGLPERSADLVAAAQAAHWFDLAAFHAEVRRVARPRCVVALWCYELMTCGKEIDDAVVRFYSDRVGRYWPAERAWIEQGYRTLDFPYDEIDPPPFAIESSLTREAFLGYVGTWSAVARCRAAEGVDPMEAFAAEIARSWTDPGEVRGVRFPLALRVGRL